MMTTLTERLSATPADAPAATDPHVAVNTFNWLILLGWPRDIAAALVWPAYFKV